MGAHKLGSHCGLNAFIFALSNKIIIMENIQEVYQQLKEYVAKYTDRVKVLWPHEMPGDWDDEYEEEEDHNYKQFYVGDDPFNDNGLEDNLLNGAYLVTTFEKDPNENSIGMQWMPYPEEPIFGIENMKIHLHASIG